MDGELTAYCRSFWNLRKKMLLQQEEFVTLLNAAPAYTEQTEVRELDKIIKFNRDAQKMREDTDETVMHLREMESAILMMMKHFKIPYSQMIYSDFPGEFEFGVWADEQDIVHAIIIQMLEPMPEDPNVIHIKFCDFLESTADKRKR